LRCEQRDVDDYDRIVARCTADRSRPSHGRSGPCSCVASV
jgi:endonuclease YncB( thermonuclease family)